MTRERNPHVSIEQSLENAREEERAAKAEEAAKQAALNPEVLEPDELTETEEPIDADEQEPEHIESNVEPLSETQSAPKIGRKPRARRSLRGPE